MIELTEKQRWFFDEYAVDLNPVRAAKKVGLTQREYDALLSGEDFNDHILEATRRYNEAAAEKPEAEKIRPAPSSVGLDPEKVTREHVNRELIAVMTDLKAEAISPGQATASVNVIKALAQVNGLITTELTVTKKSISDMSTEELYAILSERDAKLIDATAQPDAEPDANTK